MFNFCNGIIIPAILLFCLHAKGAAFISVQNGTWSSNSSWEGGIQPGNSPGDTIIINHKVSFSGTLNILLYLKVEIGGKLYSNAQNNKVSVHEDASLVNLDSIVIKDYVNSGNTDNYGYISIKTFDNVLASSEVHNRSSAIIEVDQNMDNDGTIFNDGTVITMHNFINNSGTLTGSGGSYLMDFRFENNAGAVITCNGDPIDVCRSDGTAPDMSSNGIIDSGCVSVCGVLLRGGGAGF